MLTEIDKLLTVRTIGDPATLFDDVPPKILADWRHRAAVEWPSHLRDHLEPLRLTLLAALLHQRQREITDTLVDLLIATVHRIDARAEKRVTEELVSAFRRVTGKEQILLRLAEASLARPDDRVRDVVFPAVSGGEQTLREVVSEFKTTGSTYRRTVQTTLKASYTNHYRRGLIRLVEVLEFRSSNAHRPVTEALAVIARYATGLRRRRSWLKRIRMLVAASGRENTVAVIRGGNATIYVSDMQRAVDFYQGTLGLQLTFRAGDHLG
jgi:Transposase./Glyoxalase/Bleomycin resistance protein/Dioxygenase superfamily.